MDESGNSNISAPQESAAINPHAASAHDEQHVVPLFEETIDLLYAYILHRTRIPEVAQELTVRTYATIVRYQKFMWWKRSGNLQALFSVADSLLRPVMKWHEEAIGSTYLQCIRQCLDPSEDHKMDARINSFIHAIQSLPAQQQQIAVHSLILKLTPKQSSVFLGRDAYFITKEYAIVLQILTEKMKKNTVFTNEDPEPFLQKLHYQPVPPEIKTAIRNAVLAHSTDIANIAFRYVMPAASAAIVMSTFAACILIVAAYFISPLSARSSIEQIAAVDTLLLSRDLKLRDDLQNVERNLVGVASHHARKDMAANALSLAPYATEKQIRQSRAIALILAKMGYKSTLFSSVNRSRMFGNDHYLAFNMTKAFARDFVQPLCGDAICSEQETCKDCPEDCGLCQTFCGDGLCTHGPNCSGNSPNCVSGETCGNCAEDCGNCFNNCGNGVCEKMESMENCPGDCTDNLPSFSLDPVIPEPVKLSPLFFWRVPDEKIKNVLAEMKTFIEEEAYPYSSEKSQELTTLMQKKDLGIIDIYHVVNLLKDIIKTDGKEVAAITDNIFFVLRYSGQLSIKSGDRYGTLLSLFGGVPQVFATSFTEDSDAMNRALIAAKKGDIKLLIKLLPDPEKSLPEIQESMDQYARIFDTQDQVISVKDEPKTAFKRMRAYQERAIELAMDPERANLSTEESIDALLTRNAVLSEVVSIAPDVLEQDLRSVKIAEGESDSESILSIIGIVRFIQSTANFERLEERFARSVGQMETGFGNFIALFRRSVTPEVKAAEILQEKNWNQDDILRFTSSQITAQAQFIANGIVDTDRENLLIIRLQPERRLQHVERRRVRDEAFENAATLEDLRNAIELHGTFLTELEKDVRSHAFILLRIIFRTQDWLGIG